MWNVMLCSLVDINQPFWRVFLPPNSEHKNTCIYSFFCLFKFSGWTSQVRASIIYTVTADITLTSNLENHEGNVHRSKAFSFALTYAEYKFDNFQWTMFSLGITMYIFNFEVRYPRCVEPKLINGKRTVKTQLYLFISHEWVDHIALYNYMNLWMEPRLAFITLRWYIIYVKEISSPITGALHIV